MKKEYISIILDFAEGRMSAVDFWNFYQKNQDFKEAVINDLNINKFPGAYFDPAEFLSKGVNTQSYGNTSNLYGVAKKILRENNIIFTPTNFYNDRYRFLIKIQPDWLDITYSNEEFLIDLVSKTPKNLSEAQKIKWCKDKLKELFKYDSRPPRWVQYADWPIKNGKPLVFKGQSKERKESELVKFFFYNPETDEETIVEQYY